MYRKYYIVLLLALVLYAALLILKFSTGTQLQFIQNYLADVLCLPIILALSLILIRKIKRLPYFYISQPMLVFTWLYTSAIFEWWLPQLNSKYTSDWFDVAAYALGGIIFFSIQNKLKRDEYHLIKT